ncbi:PocR ligand-binding domain-containing protein [Enterococcus sp. CSURQ0835]|uniref:PocR ligand-binding domain-containing protein n=1 Tax=Enterococcus sp. CSURQ0835 TaxID=2681394 RepID=UPI0013571A9E|nr:PocR ligand-binding domain-containing protein [Enterococcus sp. CSURQ0835]
MGLPIKLEQILELEKWNKLQDKIAQLTQVRLVLIDRSGHALSQVSGQQPFCQVLQQEPKLKNYCGECRMLALKKAAQTQQPCVYNCHLGLVDIVIPLMSDRRFLGAIVAGQVRLKEPKHLPPILNFSDEQLRRTVLATNRGAYQAIPEKTLAEIQQITDFLVEISSYLISESLKKNYFIDAYQNALHLEATDLNDSSACNKTKAVPKTYLADNQLLQPAIDAILENQSIQYTLNELAEITNLSPAYLSRLIKEEFGDSFSHIYRKLKMHWAIELLEDPNLSIHEISHKLGYPDPSYFIRLFKQTIGMTPLKYRKKHQKQPI